ncbi:MAG TPA: hypothetical protein VLC98_17400 [Phnomibacter sp.]|nr:hypothetical protein [Phnomibacter sp.]
MKKLIAFLFSLFAMHAAIAQKHENPPGRNVEVVPYPYRYFSFISPRYTRLFLENEKWSDTYLLRTMISVKGRWHFRMDLPYVNTNATATGKTISGMGDMNVKVIKSFVQKKSTFFGAALLAGFPTASHEEIGNGKFTLDPQLGGFHVFNNETGSAVLALDYNFSYAGDPNRSNISVLGIMPNVDWWGKKTYAGYYATWYYNFITHKWDIPIDIEVGHQILKKVYLSAEWIYPLQKDPTYLQSITMKLRYSILQGRRKT